LVFEEFEEKRLPLTTSEKWRNTNLSNVYEREYIVGDEKPVFDKQINEIFHCNVHGFDTNVFAFA